MSSHPEVAMLRARIAHLEQYLDEAADAMELQRAIREGEVDGLVIDGEGGLETYTLTSADRTYRLLVEEIAEGALIVSREGSVLFENASAKELLGGSLLGRRLSEGFAGDAREDVEALWSEGGATEGLVHGERVPRGRALRVSARQMRVDDTDAFAVVLTDLTVHNELVTAEATSRSRERFISMVGHELRNPLGAIGVALAALEGTREAEARERLNRIIRRQFGQLSSVVDDLTDLARIDQGKLHVEARALDVGDLVHDILESEELKVKDGGSRLRYSRGPQVWAEVDAVRFRQVLSNLISNALEAVESGGRITVDVVEDRDAGEAIISVTDDGRGIEADDLDRVFEAFEQIERPGGGRRGLGLGLAISRALIAAHRGELSVSSEGPGKGTTFHIRLPTFRA